MNSDQQVDFFVSYNSADAPWAEWIAAELEAARYTVLIQAWDFLAGNNFVLQTHAAVMRAERTIAILSPSYLTSTFPQPEWAEVFARDPTGAERRLLPVRVAACNPTGLLRSIVYIDLVGMAETDARQRLLHGVAGRIQRTASGFPGNLGVSRSRFPGTSPTIWNVPLNRNPNFTGRDESLTALHRSFVSGNPGSLVHALTGLGGVGKTQLALAYCYAFANEYDVVWWVRAEESTTLEVDFGSLADRLGIVPASTPGTQADYVKACRDWLRTHDRWLLVFDNAVDPADLEALLPQGPGHSIITSRNPHWRRVARSSSVPVFSCQASVAFLLARTGQTDRDAAARLAELFGHLPLALEQVAAYTETHAVSLAEYLGTYEARLRLLVDTGGRDLESEAGSTVSTVWELSFEKVLERSAAAADLLYLCAVLAPEEIPKEMLRDGCSDIETAARRAAIDGRLRTALTAEGFEDAVAELTRHSLIEVRGDTLFIHRLVQAVTRQRMGVELRNLWERLASEIVDRALLNPGALSAKELLPQTLSVGQRADKAPNGTRSEERYALTLEGADTVVCLEGELDPYAGPDLRRLLERIKANPPKHLVVDISRLRLIDSSGVGMLVALFKTVRASGGIFSLRGAKDQPLSILRLLRIDRLLISDN